MRWRIDTVNSMFFLQAFATAVIPVSKRSFTDYATPADIVWPEAKQIGLIDSILRNFYIPPVIFGSSIAMQ